MSLEDIKKSIQDEAQVQVKEVETQGQKRIDEVNSLWSKKIDDRKSEIIASAKRKTNQKVQQSEFKLQSQIQTEILNKKQSIIDQVYKTAVKKLSELDDAKYVELIEKLIDSLSDEGGKIISVKGKEDLLKKALKKAKKDFEVSKDTINGSGGFVYQSENIEVDYTFETLVHDAKEATILDVTTKLFNQED